MWREAWANKETALRTRFSKSSEALNTHVKQLPPLNVGDRCFIQNQTGNNPTKWHRTGTVVEACEHNQYLVKVDGSGRLTKRNRRFLRAFKPASVYIENAPRSLNEDSAKSAPVDVDVSPQLDLPTAPESYTAPEPIETPPQSLELATEPDETSSPPHSSEVPIQQPSHAIPPMLRRILPYNSAGKSEQILAPEDGGRRRRRALDS